MSRKVLIINGHPDGRPERFCAALAQRYATGAQAAGHDVRVLKVSDLVFDLLRTKDDFEDHDPPPQIQSAQADLIWADHLVIVHPLWMGSAPALLKGFFEQTFRYGFALPKPGADTPRGRLSGRSARLIVTMGMPAFVYRLAFGAFGVRAMARGILRLSGIAPVRISLIGDVEGPPASRAAWLAKIEALGRRGA